MSVDVLANDVHRGPVDVNVVRQSSAGTAAWNATSQRLVFTPLPDFKGRAELTYAITDGSTRSAAVVDVTVLSSKPVVAVDDTAQVGTGGTTAIRVLDNDLGLDGDASPEIRVRLTGNPGLGTPEPVEIEGYWKIRYVAGRTTGTDVFGYAITDLKGNILDTADIRVTVFAPPDDPAQDLPVYVDRTVVLQPGASADFYPADFDHLPPDWFLVHVTRDPTYGTVTRTQRGNGITYRADDDVSGITDTVCYIVTKLGPNVARLHRLEVGMDPDVRSVPECDGRITVIIAGPVAVDDDATLAQGARTIQIDVGRNDLGIPEGDCLDFPDHTSFADLRPGKLPGTVLYALRPGRAGLDSFSYTWAPCEGSGPRASATVAVTIEGPVAVDDSRSLYSGDTVHIDVKANDKGAAGFTVGHLSGPAHGNALVVPGEGTDSVVSYTADTVPAQTLDSFTYDLLDADLHTVATATVHLTIDPVALVPDVVHVAPGSGPVTVDVLANDTLPGAKQDRGWLRISRQPARGTAAVTKDSDTDDAITYTPDTRFTGDDSFDYAVYGREGDAQTSRLGVATVTVRRVVLGDDSAASAFGLPVDIPVLANDTGVDDLAVVASDTGSAHGTVTVTSPGTFTYTPDAAFSGTASFRYGVLEGSRVVATAAVDVTVPERPVAVADGPRTTRPGVPLTVDVLANDLHASGLVPVVTGPPSHGEATVDGTSITYTPGPGFVGDDTVTYTLRTSDGAHRFGSAVLAVTVLAPITTDDTASVFRGQHVTVDVRRNDEFGGAFLVQPGTAKHGTATSPGPGLVRYAPTAGDPATSDDVPYALLDRDDHVVATGTLHVTIVPVPDLASGTTWTARGQAVTVPVLDAGGPPAGITAAVLTPPGHGAATLAASGLTYTPGSDFAISDSVEIGLVGLVDGTPTTLTHATVTIVEERAVDDTATTTSPSPVALPVRSNDIDPRHLALVRGTAAHGTVTEDSSGRLVYTPSGSYSGPDSFTYALGDGTRSTPTAVVHVTVNPAVVVSPSHPVQPTPTPTTPTPTPTTPTPTPTTPTPTTPTTPPSPPGGGLTVLGPRSAEPGGPLTLHGTGCPAGGAVRVVLAGRTTVTGRAAADGSWSLDVPAPSTLGRYQVTVSCGGAARTVALDVVSTESASLVGAPAAAAAAVVVAGGFLFFLLTGLGLSSGRRSA